MPSLPRAIPPTGPWSKARTPGHMTFASALHTLASKQACPDKRPCGAVNGVTFSSMVGSVGDVSKGWGPNRQTQIVGRVGNNGGHASIRHNVPESRHMVGADAERGFVRIGRVVVKAEMGRPPATPSDMTTDRTRKFAMND